MLWYSLEVLHQGASNEYPQHTFLWTNKKDISIFRMKKVPYLLLCVRKLKSKYEQKHTISYNIACASSLDSVQAD